MRPRCSAMAGVSGRTDASFCHELKAAMFAFRVAAICLQKQCNRREAVPVLVGEFRAEFEQKREPSGFRVSHGPITMPGSDARAHRVQAACRLDLSLQGRRDRRHAVRRRRPSRAASG